MITINLNGMTVRLDKAKEIQYKTEHAFRNGLTLQLFKVYGKLKEGETVINENAE